MRKLIFPAVLLCFASLPVFGADTVIEEIVARVNDQIITRTEYNRGRDQLKQEITARHRQPGKGTGGARKRRSCVT